MAILAGQRVTAAAINSLKPSLPYLHAYQSATQTLTNAIAAAVTMTSEVVDTINGHSTSVNTSRYTPNVAGTYQCFGMVAFAVSTAGDRAAHFRLNNVQSNASPYGPMPSMKGAAFLGGAAYASASFVCNGSTDYIELFGSQNSGGNLDTMVTVNGFNSFMIIRWVSP